MDDTGKKPSIVDITRYIVGNPSPLQTAIKNGDTTETTTILGHVKIAVLADKVAGRRLSGLIAKMLQHKDPKGQSLMSLAHDQGMDEAVSIMQDIIAQAPALTRDANHSPASFAGKYGIREEAILRE